MLSMLCRVLFFLCMFILYVYVTSTSIVILIVLGYITCVFTYYYFNNVRCAIDECFNYCNFNAPSATSLSPPQVSGYFVNRKYDKMSNTGIGPMNSKKVYSPLSLGDRTFPKENNLLGSAGASMLRFDYKNVGLPSPVLRASNSSFRANRISADKFKTAFSPMDVARKNGLASSSFDLSRRSNSNLDMETFMNVNSPGFTSRVVGKAAESASYHMKYPTVRQVSSCRFDKSVLRQLSKIPRVNAEATTATVRIASPEVACMNLPPNEPTANEDIQDTSKNNHILQVLKEMSRKRNHANEETDRSGSTPKKSRKNETRNVTTSSQHKRAHEDGPDDASEYESRKRRCDEQDRAIVKMMSYTSGLGVKFTAENQSKKRKSSKLENSEYDSPEKSEKFRKISDERVLRTTIESIPEDVSMAESFTTTIPTPARDESGHSTPQHFVDSTPNHIDETDKEEQVVSLASFMDEDRDQDEDSVCMAGGSILNRANGALKKKLHSKKIDPDSVIYADVPEYVTRANKVNDEVLKRHLLDNIISAVERNDATNFNVTLHQSSIVEEMANKKVVEVEVHQPPASVQTASTADALQPPASTSTLPLDTSVTATANSGVATTPLVTSSAAPATSTNPLLQKQPVGLAFGRQPVDDVDSSQTVVAPSPKPVQPISTARTTSSTSTSSNGPSATTPAMTPATVFSSVATKPAAEAQKSPATSSSVNGSASFSTDTNPLLVKSLVATPEMVAFSNPAASAAEKTSIRAETEKVVVSSPVNADSSSKSVVATSAATAPTASLFSTAVQSSTTSSNQPTAEATPKFQFPSPSGGFKFGSGQATGTKASSFNVNSAPAVDTSAPAVTVSPFTASTATTAFSSDNNKPSSFASASSSAAPPPFSFGAPNSTASDSVFGNQPTTTNAPKSTFNVTIPQKTYGPFETFGQRPSSTVAFGSAASLAQPAAFGGFGQSSSSASTASTTFGNATQAVGGGGDSGTVFAQTGPGSTTNTQQSSQFLFGDGKPTSTTFGASAFGGQPSFGANAGTTGFNFSNQTSSFGSSNGGATGGTFATAAGGAQPGNNAMFNFGSGGNAAAATAAPAQSTFQFQPSVPSQPSQPAFSFGPGAPAAASTAAGGFSIGTGSSGASGRSRVIARSRKAK